MFVVIAMVVTSAGKWLEAVIYDRVNYVHKFKGSLLVVWITYTGQLIGFELLIMRLLC